jgi:hypothetical protein
MIRKALQMNETVFRPFCLTESASSTFMCWSQAYEQAFEQAVNRENCRPTSVRIPNGSQFLFSGEGYDCSDFWSKTTFASHFRINAGGSWTIDFCEMDSDEDGATNGEELGDPCCEWNVGDSPKNSKVADPGRHNSFSADELARMKCNSTKLNNTDPQNTTESPSSLSISSSEIQGNHEDNEDEMNQNDIHV